MSEDAVTGNELLHRIDKTTGIIATKVEALERHAAEMNGRLGAVEIKAAEAAGAAAFARWAFTALAALMTVGIGVAGVVLTLVAR